MAAKTDPQLDVNSWLQDELREQYRHDRTSIDDEWKHLFDSNAPPKPKETNGTLKPAPPSTPALPPAPEMQVVSRPSPPPPIVQTGEEELQPLRGAAGAIARNMNASVAIPLATSQRIIPVK